MLLTSIGIYFNPLAVAKQKQTVRISKECLKHLSSKLVAEKPSIEETRPPRLKKLSSRYRLSWTGNRSITCVRQLECDKSAGLDLHAEAGWVGPSKWLKHRL